MGSVSVDPFVTGRFKVGQTVMVVGPGRYSNSSVALNVGKVFFVVQEYHNGTANGYYISSVSSTDQNRSLWFYGDTLIEADRKTRAKYIKKSGLKMAAEGERLLAVADKLERYDSDEEEVAALLVEIQESSDLSKADKIKKIAAMLSNRVKTDMI